MQPTNQRNNLARTMNIKGSNSPWPPCNQTKATALVHHHPHRHPPRHPHREAVTSCCGVAHHARASHPSGATLNDVGFRRCSPSEAARLSQPEAASPIQLIPFFCRHAFCGGDRRDRLDVSLVATPARSSATQPVASTCQHLLTRGVHNCVFLFVERTRCILCQRPWQWPIMPQPSLVTRLAKSDQWLKASGEALGDFWHPAV